MKLNDVVVIKDKAAVRADVFLDQEALAVIEANNFQGVITKISDGIFFVGFKNDLGWVTQGFKANEIEVVKVG